MKPESDAGDDEMHKTPANKNVVQESRKRIIGKTWLTLQLMQGSTLTCHHQPKRHFAKIGNIIVTEEHESEAGLVGELIEFHGFTFRGLKCKSSVGYIDSLVAEWKRG